MCGIVAVLRRRDPRPAPDLGPITGIVQSASRAVADAAHGAPELVACLTAIASDLRGPIDDLTGPAGARAILGARADADGLRLALDALGGQLDDLEQVLDTDGVLASSDVEAVNAALVAARDAVWALRRDILVGAEVTGSLAGAGASDAAIEAFDSIRVALSAIDRLEVRGRDSAGLHVMVTGHGLDLTEPALARQLASRASDALFTNGSVRVAGESLSFVYKAAAEIGELGDNTAHLRATIQADALLHMALQADTARASILGHTRWASVGIISQPNAHPLNHEEVDASGGPYVAASLNGDIDNHADLEVLEGLRVAPEITTDAKVIPAIASRRLAEGLAPLEAVAATVAPFEGSVAIGVQVADDPDRLYLAVRGSGQGLYVGMAHDAFLVASEPYGVVERASSYLRLDGETPARAEDPVGSRGQIVVLDAAGAGELSGITRVAYDGTPLPVTPEDLDVAEITTRDIDRGDAPHYLLKEIGEAPRSLRKTLRGKLVERDGLVDVSLDESVLPAALKERLAGSIRRVYVIGQGTAAAAGQSAAVVLDELLSPAGVRVESILATELSGFRLSDDMSDTLVVAISQSGTTTDTNRTVDLARDRGAGVIAIVNRRNSDLVSKADGVLYTSDGRDVEMSVASTKAFYAQVAAGFLLAHAIAVCVPGAVDDASARSALLSALRDLPERMEMVIATRPHIAEVARAHAPQRRYWALTGNGRNAIAARELRIKLSELCYKSIACDATEDKKHIDLSAEPMIIVCAAGLSGSNADDVGKELAIYRAHKAAPIAIATAGESRLTAALDTIEVPSTHPDLGFVLATVAGHLFGYEAALAIDASARPLREIRAAIEATVAAGVLDGRHGLEPLANEIIAPATRFFDGLHAGQYDGALEARTAVRTATMLRYGTGMIPLDLYQVETGRVGTPSTLVLDLTDALTQAIEELTRPVDAIKHQAKTVTVGISRSDETLLRAPLVQAVLDAGTVRDGLSYRALRTLVDLDEVVEAVTGYTRYQIEGDIDRDDEVSAHVVDRGGIAAEIPSRTDRDPRLRGTKHRAAAEREVTVAKGRRDGRTVILVPEVKGTEPVGITLLHVRFATRPGADVAARVLRGYRNRYGALRDAITETEPSFDESVLGEIDMIDLLTEPVNVLAERWRTPQS